MLTLLSTLVHWLAIAVRAESTWPASPFITSGRWIANANGANFAYAGVNWPAAGEVMIPEGLQYQSIETIVAKVKSLGMNAIRLTYAIEMIDQIYDHNGSDILLEKAFIDALGQRNGRKAYQAVVTQNPSFGPQTTRLQVFDAVAAECAKQQIYVHLDNHVSKAKWCCTPLDGNAWWGDQYFSTANWTRGLSYMADHGKKWPSLTSMSLRNELRQPLLNITLYKDTYNWEYWYARVKEGADAVHKANPNVLVFLSGIDSDTILTPVVEGTSLPPGTGKFTRADFSGYQDKIVLELHNYQNQADNCTALQADLLKAGFEALVDGATNQFPLAMTEFGFAQDNDTWNGVYAACLGKFLPDQKASWFIWVLSGSYYIREGTQDYDEPWGLLTHDWSAWRSPGFVERGLIPMVNATLSALPAINQTKSSPGPSSGDTDKKSSGPPAYTAWSLSRLCCTLGSACSMLLLL